MVRPIFSGLLALLVVGCARDPWDGTWDGTSVSDGRDCETGEPISAPVVQSNSVTIIRRSERGLAINGGCFFTLEELSDEQARFDATECDTTLDDGTPIHYRLITGRASLDGDELTIETDVDLRSPTVCLFATSTFIGTRVND